MLSSSISLRLELLGLNPMDLDPFLSANPDYQIELYERMLSVFHLNDKHHVFVDFDSKQLKFRSQFHLNAELIIKAVLGKKKTTDKYNGLYRWIW